MMDKKFNMLRTSPTNGDLKKIADQGKVTTPKMNNGTNNNNNNNINNNDENADDLKFRRGERKNVARIKKGAEKGLDYTIFETFTIKEKKKTVNDVNFIIACLKTHFVFYNLSEHELENIVNKMFYCEVSANNFVFKQGDDASLFFIIERGILEVIINDKVKRELHNGEGFGELALLYNAPRSASVRATDNCTLWGIDRKTFRRAVEEMIIKEYDENRKFIDAVRFFNTMTAEQKNSIASVLITQKFSKGQCIVNEGDPASSFYIIKEGAVQVLKGNKEIRKMLKGDSFGEQALYYNTLRSATVKTIDNVKCLALGRDTLTNILGDQVQTITFKNLQKWAFEKNALLNKLTKVQVEKVIDSMKIVNRKAGEIILQKGTLCNQKIIVIIEGTLKKSKSGNILAKKGESIGDEYLIQANSSKTWDDNIIIDTDGVLSEIDLNTFTECIGGTIEEVIKKNESSHERKMMNIASELKKFANSIKLDDLIFYKKLGAGQFGSVYMVKVKSLDQFFALKVVSKQMVVENNLEKHLQQEKSVLETVNFPFIVQFIRTFKDHDYLYFLLECVKGMELFDVIRDMNLLQTYESQFFIGALILAVEYLHLNNIIYRDIKPENIMVDDMGYLKLIDMGTGKFLKSAKGAAGRTFTIIGTPHYMAPEIISGKGYSFPVDLWSIGILLFELMCGMVPFGEECDDPYEIYQEVITKSLRYPNYHKDKKSRKLMDQLLNKLPDLRLGGSYAALKAHSWFEGFSWDELLDKKLKAPYIPKKNIMSEAELKKLEQANKKVILLIEEEHKANPQKYKSEQSNDPFWDKGF